MKKRTFSELKKAAKQSYHAQLGDLMVSQLIYLVSLNIITVISVTLGTYIVYGPAQFGLYETFYKASKGEEVTPACLTRGYRERFGDSFLGGLIQYLIGIVPSLLFSVHIAVVIASLASFSSKIDFIDFGIGERTLVFSIFTAVVLLLVDILSIVMKYAMAMTQYIMIREPDIKPFDALKKSGRLMKGNKMRLFLLKVTFIGWALLTLITGSISNIYSLPYLTASKIQMFNDIYESRN